MRSDFSRYNQFAKLAMLDEKFDPWVRPRRPSCYGDCVISDSLYNDPLWSKSKIKPWYWPFVGVKFFAELHFESDKFPGNINLVEVTPVRLMKTKKNHGRSIDAKHIILL